MRNKNLWIILAAVLVIALVAVLAAVVQPAVNVTDEVLTPPVTTDAAPVGEPAAYLLVTVGGITYQPIPLQGEGEFSLTQGEGEMVNTVHVTPDSVWMAASTCDNQDCVDQGVVALSTMDERVLGNMIICLPHQVTLELYTAAEMNALIASVEKEAAQ